MKKDTTIAKRVVILLVILMLDHFTQASLNSFDLNQGIRRELRTRKKAPPPPILRRNVGFKSPPPRHPPPRVSSHPPPPPSPSSLLP
ncbi:hypothetical protein Tco_1203930 [Tanacetum coccineum]